MGISLVLLKVILGTKSRKDVFSTHVLCWLGLEHE